MKKCLKGKKKSKSNNNKKRKLKATYKSYSEDEINTSPKSNINIVIDKKIPIDNINTSKANIALTNEQIQIYIDFYNYIITEDETQYNQNEKNNKNKGENNQFKISDHNSIITEESKHNIVIEKFNEINNDDNKNQFQNFDKN